MFLRWGLWLIGLFLAKCPDVQSFSNAGSLRYRREREKEREILYFTMISFGLWERERETETERDFLYFTMISSTGCNVSIHVYYIYLNISWTWGNISILLSIFSVHVNKKETSSIVDIQFFPCWAISGDCRLSVVSGKRKWLMRQKSSSGDKN